jgi:hypothetical protein
MLSHTTPSSFIDPYGDQVIPSVLFQVWFMGAFAKFVASSSWTTAGTELLPSFRTMSWHALLPVPMPALICILPPIARHARNRRAFKTRLLSAPHQSVSQNSFALDMTKLAYPLKYQRETKLKARSASRGLEIFGTTDGMDQADSTGCSRSDAAASIHTANRFFSLFYL